MPVSLAAGAAAGITGALVPIISVYPYNTSVSITNIPQIYQDLFITIQGRDRLIPGPRTQLFFGFNNSAVGTDYGGPTLESDGTTISSSRIATNQFTAPTFPGYNATANVISASIIHILNYKSTDRYKTILVKSSNDQSGAGVAGWTAQVRRTNTDAINQIDFRNTFTHGSSINVYGIRAGN